MSIRFRQILFKLNKINEQILYTSKLCLTYPAIKEIRNARKLKANNAIEIRLPKTVTLFGLNNKL